MLMYLKKWTNLSQPLVFENRNIDIFKRCTNFVNLWGWKIEMLIYLKKWTNLKQPLVFENRNVDKSYVMDQF